MYTTKCDYPGFNRETDTCGDCKYHKVEKLVIKNIKRIKKEYSIFVLVGSFCLEFDNMR